MLVRNGGDQVVRPNLHVRDAKFVDASLNFHGAELG